METVSSLVASSKSTDATDATDQSSAIPSASQTAWQSYETLFAMYRMTPDYPSEFKRGFFRNRFQVPDDAIEGMLCVLFHRFQEESP